MKTLIAVMLVITCVVFADEVDDIREYYNEVKEHLDDEYGLFRTEISLNTEGGIYPVIGTYQENITFYWDSEGGYVWLVLVTWTGKYATRHDYGEVLYSEVERITHKATEEVVFQYVLSHGWDGNDTEYQWWFADGELLQSYACTVTPDIDVEFTPEDPEAYGYIYTPEKLLDLFYMIHD